MIEIVKLTPDLLRAIDPQPMQSTLGEDHVSALGQAGDAYCVLVDGVPVAAGGLVELWEGRAHAWALLGKQAKHHLLPITRAIRKRLASVPFRRIEMAVDAGFPQAIHWADMLGFECETPEPMRAYSPDGRACYLFARVT